MHPVITCLVSVVMHQFHSYPARPEIKNKENCSIMQLKRKKERWKPASDRILKKRGYLYLKGPKAHSRKYLWEKMRVDLEAPFMGRGRGGIGHEMTLRRPWPVAHEARYDSPWQSSPFLAHHSHGFHKLSNKTNYNKTTNLSNKKIKNIQNKLYNNKKLRKKF